MAVGTFLGGDFMSEHITKIIPKDPFHKVPELALQSVKTFLEAQIHCDSIKVEVTETPEFVDCGTNLESISCPECGTELDFEWWGEAMEKAADDAFSSLETEVPCCKKLVSLNDLVYNFPCGFASCLIQIINPDQPISNEMIDKIQNILGIEVRIVEAHL